MHESSGKIVFSTPWFEIEEMAPAVDADGSVRPYYRMNTEDGVMIVPRTKEGDLICVRQYRPAIGQWTLELPSGGMDGDESMEAAAARELREETRYVPGSLHHLGSGRLMANRVNAVQHIYFAQDCVLAEGASAEAGVSACLMSAADLEAEVASGRFNHMTVLGALLLAHWRGFDVGIGRTAP